MKRVLIGLAVAVVAGATIGGAVMAYEEPTYEVLEQRDDYEIRRYAPYVVAETTVEAEFREAGNQAFRRLFGYISGNNRSAASMATTVPVTASRASEKIEMTIPVVARTPNEAVEGPAPYTYAFIMPAKFTVDSLPHPDDPRITIRRVPERIVAARRYSGRSNESNYREHREILIGALDRDDVPLEGEPVLAVYNGPFTPWFLRRNEVLVDLAR